MKPESGWIDVSAPLHEGMPHWPDNPPFKIKRVKDLRRGDSSNVSLASMGTHTGTHIDAPAHFFSGGKGIDAMPFSATNGPARVVEIRSRETIDPSELLALEIRGKERLLFKTRNSGRPWASRPFTRKFVYLSTAAGRLLADRGVRTVGVDYLSVGGYHVNGGEIHRLLLKAGVWIIEGLDLSNVKPGRYQLACLPLKITGGDAAPARAFLRPN